MTNNKLTDAQISNATLIRLIRWADEHKSHYVAAALRELQERRKAAMDSEPVAWLAIYHGEVYDEAIGITRSVVEAQADHFGWESALTEIIPLYRHAQPAPVVPVVPVVPATLPCSVELKPGLIIGKGCKTETLLTALRRRADYNADIDAMTPEERAEHDASIIAFKAMLAAAPQEVKP